MAKCVLQFRSSICCVFFELCLEFCFSGVASGPSHRSHFSHCDQVSSVPKQRTKTNPFSHFNHFCSVPKQRTKTNNSAISTISVQGCISQGCTSPCLAIAVESSPQRPHPAHEAARAPPGQDRVPRRSPATRCDGAPRWTQLTRAVR